MNRSEQSQTQTSPRDRKHKRERKVWKKKHYCLALLICVHPQCHGVALEIKRERIFRRVGFLLSLKRELCSTENIRHSTRNENRMKSRCRAPPFMHQRKHKQQCVIHKRVTLLERITKMNKSVSFISLFICSYVNPDRESFLSMLIVYGLVIFFFLNLSILFVVHVWNLRRTNQWIVYFSSLSFSRSAARSLNRRDSFITQSMSQESMS